MMDLQTMLAGLMGGGGTPGLSPGGLAGPGGLAALEAAGVPAAMQGAAGGGMNPQIMQMLSALGRGGQAPAPQQARPQLPVATMPGRPGPPQMPGMMIPGGR